MEIEKLSISDNFTQLRDISGKQNILKRMPAAVKNKRINKLRSITKKKKSNSVKKPLKIFNNNGYIRIAPNRRKTVLSGKNSLFVTKLVPGGRKKVSQKTVKIVNSSIPEENLQPVFKKSEQFLELVRQSNIAYEQKNMLIEKQLENLKQHVEKIEETIIELDEEINLLAIFSEQIEKKLAKAFSKLSIPSEPTGATVENIQKYMSDLYELIPTSRVMSPDFLRKVEVIIRNLDMTVNLRDFI